MIDVFDVADVFIEHALKTHPNKIGIIACYGSYTTGTATYESDLDLVYVPDDINATKNLYNSFVLKGRPYEFWAISWNRLERIAAGDEHWAVAASMLLNMKVLFSRSEEDLTRFNGLIEKTRELMTPEKKPRMVKKALKGFTQVQNTLGKLRLEARKEHMPGIRWMAWQVIISCAECLSLVNQQYFNNGWGKNHEEILALKKRPKNIGDHINVMVSSTDSEKITETAEKLALETRDLLLEAQRETAKPTGIDNEFKDYYPGIVEYVVKVKKYAINGSPIAAKYAAAQIQVELNYMLSRGINGYGEDEFNLYSEINEIYESHGFPDLLEQAEQEVILSRIDEFGTKSREILIGHGVKLNQVEKLEDLTHFFQERANKD